MLLVLNSGSSSIKSAVFQPDLEEVVTARITGIGTKAGATLKLGETSGPIHAPDHAAALRAILQAVEGEGEITAAAHRIVHGGTALTAPVRLGEGEIAVIEANVPLAPLHNPPGLAGIRAMAASRPDLPQYACFDTAFHASQPEVQTEYALPESWRVQGIRRYGFHGLSYAGLVEQMGRDLPKRLLALHLGAGCSLCAIKDGKSLATSMGYSPVTGPTMATRTGDIDAMAVLRIAEKLGIEGAGRVLNKESGLRGLAGSADMRTLLATDSADARFAVDHFVWTVVREAGALIAVMGGVDALAFTGGIGENSAQIRDRIVAALAWIGDLPVHIVAAEEERQIARDAFRLMAKRS